VRLALLVVPPPLPTPTLALTSLSALRAGMSAFYGETDDEKSKETLRKAIEIVRSLFPSSSSPPPLLRLFSTRADLTAQQGCAIWDSARMYGLGHNEQIIGDVLREGDNRKKVRPLLLARSWTPS